MFTYSIKNERGVSLLEAMFVLVILSVLVVIGVRYFTMYQTTQRITILERSVGQLMEGLNYYYYLDCHNQLTPLDEVNIGTLEKAGLVPTNLINPWGTLDVQIVNTTNDPADPFYQLKVIAIMTVDPSQKAIQVAGFARASLSGDPGESSIVTWSRLPTHNTDDLSTKMWVLTQRTGTMFSIPSRLLTATGTGMRTDFWVMKNELNEFSHLEQSSESGVANNLCLN